MINKTFIFNFQNAVIYEGLEKYLPLHYDVETVFLIVLLLSQNSIGSVKTKKGSL